MKKVLVTGGCGYIGSHTVVDLLNNGFDVISVDNYLNSSPGALDQIFQITGKKVHNYEVDLCDAAATRLIFEEHPDLAGVIHFAALKAVGESVEKPLWYFRNNLDSLLNILECVRDFKVPGFIFSSSCSVYGNSKQLPVTEDTPFEEAESTYARTKQMGEHIVQDTCRAYKAIQAILLRYFNPAGAHESGLMGESPTYNASNLVPVITETAIGKRREVVVFGDDYPTRDGSAVRDYIHVMDLAHAHTLSLQYALGKSSNDNCEVFNLGIGTGVTVLEAIHAFERSSGQQLNYRIGPRRPGDVIAIYANNDKAARLLGWQPTRKIDDIMRTAWAWEQVRG